MEAKLVVCDKNHEQLVDQLQNMSCDLQKMEAKLADSEINREQLMVHLQVAAQLQKVRVDLPISSTTWAIHLFLLLLL